MKGSTTGLIIGAVTIHFVGGRGLLGELALGPAGHSVDDRWRLRPVVCDEVIDAIRS